MTAIPEVLAWRKSPHLSTLCVMSSSVIPLYVSSSFHTGFSVFLWVLVFSLLAWGMGTKGSDAWTLGPWGPKGRRSALGGTHKSSQCWKETYLAGSRQEVQFDIGVSQAIEIHGLEALQDTCKGGFRLPSLLPSSCRTGAPQSTVPEIRESAVVVGWGRCSPHPRVATQVGGTRTLALRILQCRVQEA